MEDIPEIKVNDNIKPNMRNEELFDAILEAYKDSIKAMVQDALGKGAWTNRELDWLYNRMRVKTTNVQTLLNYITAKENEYEQHETKCKTRNAKTEESASE